MHGSHPTPIGAPHVAPILVGAPSHRKCRGDHPGRPQGDQPVPAKIGIISLGCAKNLVNSEQMMYLLSSAGYRVSGDTDGADVVIINTCAFIENAKTEAIETILEFAAEKVAGRIGKLIVAGCLGQRYKNEILSELPEIDAVVGTGSFDDIVQCVEGNETAFFGDINSPVSETDRIISTSPVWTYIKIAEGCDNRCAYCCIPSIRGSYRSRPIENIIAEATRLTDRGIRELILVAQDVTRYGYDIYGKRRLTDLLIALENIEKLKWIRLHYLYPDEIDNELIDVIAKSDRILKYLDIPIQHINDKILRKMHRRGSGEDIKKLIGRVRERIPGVVLRTSLITGLPGEGQDEFGQLCEFLQEFKIERAGVFAYSPEEGTAAAKMKRPSKATAADRAEQLRDLQAEIMFRWNERRIGTSETVLVENTPQKSGRLARSYAESPDVDGYINIEGKNIRANTFIDIRITGIENGELVGEPQ